MNWEQRWVDGDTGWDHGEASPPLAAYLEAETLQGRALVPGCGSGHDVRLLARHGLEVTGLDLAPSALKVAREFEPVGTERYLEADWLKLPTRLRGQFDWVVEHTCLCALAPGSRDAYAASVSQALRPAGHYLAVFYRDPVSPQGPPFGISSEELDALFDGLDLVKRWKPEVAYPSRLGREEMRLYRKRATA